MTMKIKLPKEVADEISFAKFIGVTFDRYIVRELTRSDYKDAATYTMIQSPDVLNGIEMLLNAWNNGYTVEEKKYSVKVPHTKDVWYYRSWNSDLRTVTGKEICSDFTESEIEHYGLQDCEKVEVTDDEN